MIKITGIKNIEFLAKGKRGFVYTGNYKEKKVAVKSKNPKSLAVNRIQNEAKYLKLLNRYNIGPKLLFYKNNKLVYEFVEGNFIVDYIKNNNKTRINRVLNNILNQLFVLDRLKINKEEMHRPVKHIIVNKNNKPVLIDFERAHLAEKPHNVTQFCQFLINKNVNDLLKKKGINIEKKRIISLAKGYKNSMSKRNLEGILRVISVSSRA